MKKYQYQLVKYVHDHFTGEFINVGVVLYSPENQFLDCKMVDKQSRLLGLFPKANWRFLFKVFKNIENSVKSEAKLMGGLFLKNNDLDKLTSKIIAKDNSAIQFSQAKSGIDIDLKAAFNDLYFDLVEKYIQVTPKKKSLTDQDVWQTKYKRYFEEYHIANRLVKYKLVTSNDEFTFEKSWKNHIWHCYQPVSFLLQDKDSIKDKVYKWAGKLKEMKSTDEKIHLTFLTSLSRKNKDLEEFIQEYLTLDETNLQVDIIQETDAEKFVQEVQALMLAHDNE
jgi:hypothetical protein